MGFLIESSTVLRLLSTVACLQRGGNVLMKKWLSLVLSAGMLLSAYAPAVYAVSDTSAPAAAAVEATPETAEPNRIMAAALTADALGSPAYLSEKPAEEPAPQAATLDSLNDRLSFRVTTDDGVDFSSADPFGAMAMVVGKEYTFAPQIDGKPLANAGYSLESVTVPQQEQNKIYLEVVGTPAADGSFKLKATEATSQEFFLGNLLLTLKNLEDNSISPLYVACIGTTIADTGRATFVNKATGAPIASLVAAEDQKTFTLSLAGMDLDPSTMEIEYNCSAPKSVSYTTDPEEFGVVTLTVNRAISSETAFYATIKAKATGEVLKTAVLTLSWNTTISADKLPGGSTIYFGAKNDTSYMHWYSTEYNQVSGGDTPFSQTASLSIFFGTAGEDSWNITYSNLPQGSDALAGITVESLTPDSVEIVSQPTQSGEDPYNFQYRIYQDECTTAKIQATVKLSDGGEYKAVFTIDVVENLSTRELTVSSANELQAALTDPSVTPGSTILLNPARYEGDFTVSTPVTLMASGFVGTQLPYDEEGKPLTDDAPIIEGSITAKCANVEVYGLHFKGSAGETALTDVNAVSGCTFTGYDTALVLSETISASSNFRVQGNAFANNTVAVRFAGREWLSMIQDNSFLNNGTALQLSEKCYIDGTSSPVYKADVNGGKWTNNLFRGNNGQKVLQDNRKNTSATLLLNYNYFQYGTDVGASEALFDLNGGTCDHSVFYTTPQMESVSTNVSLAKLAEDGGLNLVAQQADTTVTDTALNVSSELFGTLKNNDDAEDLTLNVWTADEKVAAIWDFQKDELDETLASKDVNLGVSDKLNTDEINVVDRNLPENTTLQAISFLHEGDLPGTATVEVPLTETSLDPDNLALYYINEKDGTLDLVDTDVTVTSNDGAPMLTFDIEHCSSYVVTAKPASTEPAQPETPAEGNETPAASSGSSAGSSTAAVTATPAPSGSTPYYTCKACGYHDWTATAEGYRCDNCGYLESTKQLSGYGNVKGSYTPQAGNTSATARSLSGAIPATSDESHPMVWVALLVLAAAGFGGLWFYKHKKK